jgi:hypothetical protein
MINTSHDRTAPDEGFTVALESQVLDRLDRPDADIVILPQMLSLDLDDLVRRVPVQEKRVLVVCEDAEEQVSGELMEMGIDHPELGVEMTRSVRLFSEMFRQHRLDVRFEVTDKQSCPKFHCDNVFVRMLVTYFGPTTEFIDKNNPQEVYAAPCNALVFLKGHKHPTYQHRILHRSPLFFGTEKRLCMVVNFYDWLPTR